MTKTTEPKTPASEGKAPAIAVREAITVTETSGSLEAYDGTKTKPKRKNEGGAQ